MLRACPRAVQGLVAWPQGDDGRQRGWEVFVTLTWGFVMWHWRHQVWFLAACFARLRWALASVRSLIVAAASIRASCVCASLLWFAH